MPHVWPGGRPAAAGPFFLWVPFSVSTMLTAQGPGAATGGTSQRAGGTCTSISLHRPTSTCLWAKG